jgi:hypothetical protein
MLTKYKTLDETSSGLRYECSCLIYRLLLSIVQFDIDIKNGDRVPEATRDKDQCDEGKYNRKL